ncbi:MAG: hypothetical protein KGL19_04905 [Bacteroidota bacterium]|nr:hypothetical protein [Bacteroidota bacterium]
MQAAGDASPPLYLSFLNPIQISYMKKTILLIITAGFIFCNAYSQITKGNWMVGGSGSFSTKSNSSSNIQFNPNIGYFFGNKFAAGLKFDFASQDLSNYVQSSSIGLIVKRFSAGPFVRYYFLDSEKSFNLFTEGNYSYGTYEMTGYYPISNGKNSIYSISMGSVIYFNSSVGIEFSIGYYNINDITLGVNNNGLQMGAGFQIHLEK